ncbi:MAG: nucleotidyltransferase domain-containing protein [Acidobacteria bacterium]|nr:nucleotidyltransferase domain-containing protein [Acidobacteriota bacterium]
MRSSESKTVSGRFLLRLQARVHARLQNAARNRGLSLNEYCSRRLGVPGPALLIEDGAGAAVDRSLALFSERLVGVLVFGSFARGDAAATSDVDLLVVVDRSIPLARALYREWDIDPPAWGSRSIDPHFVQLPADVRAMPGAWCEAAIDGVVLFERDGVLTRHLAAVRGDIATGRLVRRSVHGQPYWTVAA